MNFSIEESKENDLIIKAATGNIKTRTIRNLLFSLTLQAVRINNQGAPLLGLAKSIYYILRHAKKRSSVDSYGIKPCVKLLYYHTYVMRTYFYNYFSVHKDLITLTLKIFPFVRLLSHSE